MGKIYSIETYLSDEDAFDIRIEVEKGEVLNFSINFRVLANDKWNHVYRIDTAHGCLHELRYWIGTESVSLKSKENLFAIRKELFNRCIDDVKRNYKLYKKLYFDKVGEEL